MVPSSSWPFVSLTHSWGTAQLKARGSYAFPPPLSMRFYRSSTITMPFSFLRSLSSRSPKLSSLVPMGGFSAVLSPGGLGVTRLDASSLPPGSPPLPLPSSRSQRLPSFLLHSLFFLPPSPPLSSRPLAFMPSRLLILHL